MISWLLSNTLDADFCIHALNCALEHSQPDIFNTDQGCQFTSHRYLLYQGQRRTRYYSTKVGVLEFLQEKTVFIERDEHDQDKRVIKAAELPKHPIPKSAVSLSMLAYIIYQKKLDWLADNGKKASIENGNNILTKMKQ